MKKLLALLVTAAFGLSSVTFAATTTTAPSAPSQVAPNAPSQKVATTENTGSVQDAQAMHKKDHHKKGVAQKAQKGKKHHKKSTNKKPEMKAQKAKHHKKHKRA